jgi:hypothetical protein
MEDTITTVDNHISQSSKAETNSSNANYDTVTLLMVPAKDVEEHVSNLQNQGLGIVSQYTFKDLRAVRREQDLSRRYLYLEAKRNP